MTFSMELLPAPFGPMIASISPLRISKPTPSSARMPPNDRLMFSTLSSTSPIRRAARAHACIACATRLVDPRDRRDRLDLQIGPDEEPCARPRKSPSPRPEPTNGRNTTPQSNRHSVRRWCRGALCAYGSARRHRRRVPCAGSGSAGSANRPVPRLPPGRDSPRRWIRQSTCRLRPEQRGRYSWCRRCRAAPPSCRPRRDRY